MVIGHSFTFSCSEDANQFLRFLRKEGISARVESIPQTSYSFMIKGRYENLCNYLAECLDKLQKTESSDSENTEIIDKRDEPELDPKEKEEFLEEINFLREMLDKQREHASKNLEGKNQGEIAFEPHFSETEGKEEEIKEYMNFLYENKILMDNGIFEFTDNVLRYDTIKPVEDLDYSYGISPYLVPDDDKLDKYGISRIQKISAEVDYTVRAGPDIIGIELQKLKDELALIEENEDYVIHAVHSINLKRELVDHIISVMQDSDADTIDDLVDELELCPSVYDTNERSIISYDISYEFTSEVIEDLKKLEFLRVKGNKIKLVRK
ncbi:MAG: hypothetical protein GXY48_10685 [Methanomicrobiales archaeon]|nr:hypothetical protein [Methanomicrobiales archaeon]